MYIGGGFETIDRNVYPTSSVELKSISSNKSCRIQSLNYGLTYHASVVTPIGVITCGGKTLYGRARKECVRLTDQNTWVPFPSMNVPHFLFEIIVIGEILIAFGDDDSGNVFEMINWRSENKWKLIALSKTFLNPCVTKWNDENILITGGRKSVNKPRHYVSNTNIKRLI